MDDDLPTFGLVLGLLWAAVRWHAALAPARVSYWLRPYSDQLDRRCWRWRRPPCQVLVLPQPLSRAEVAAWLREQLGEEYADCSPAQLAAMESTLYRRQPGVVDA